MLDDWHFLGMSGQNWIPAFGVVLLIYIAVLVTMGRWRTPTR